MQKNKKIKSIISVVLCVIMVITSIPFALAAGPGAYNPVPTFADEDIKKSVSAWTKADGSVEVRYPKATAQKTFDNSRQKEIKGYLLELVDMGPEYQVHTDKVVYSKVVPATADAIQKAQFTANEIDTIPTAMDLSVDRRYNVTITAMDDENWFSEDINVIVSNVPEYEYDPDLNGPLSLDAHAMREMMTFEGSNAASGVFGGTLLRNHGSYEQIGAEAADTGKDTFGVRLSIEGKPNGAQQSFDTSWSRQTWDFSGAEEVWFWLDLSQVELTGISFRLRANDKNWGDWNPDFRDAPLDNGAQTHSGVVYSTIGTTKPGYKGEKPYVFVQRANGTWDKVFLNNGTVDLGHMKGYVRVPLEFMCSETDTYVNVKNDTVGQLPGNAFFGSWNQVFLWKEYQIKEAQTQEWMRNQTYDWNSNTAIKADAAGTSINDALLLHGRILKSKTGRTTDPGTWSLPFGRFTSGYGAGGAKTEPGLMLAPGIDAGDAVKPNAENPRRATVYDDWQTRIANGQDPINNRENGYKAIEDLYSAGVAFTDCSSESVNRSIFMDNILFYRTDGKEYSENTLNGQPNKGDLVSKYYDQTNEIPYSIFLQIDDMIKQPDLADFRAVGYIEALIEGYKEAFAAAGADTSFLEESALEQKAADFGVDYIWQKFINAREACRKYETIDKTNVLPTELTPFIETELEKLPAFDTMVTADQATREARKEFVKRIFEIYTRLNLSQLDALGKASEEKLIEYINYFENNSEQIVVGQKLTDNPFIPFNTFEENYEVGQHSWQVENDPNYNQGYSGGVGYRYTKNLVTYNVKDLRTYTGKASDTSLAPPLADATKSAFNGDLLNQNPSWADITRNGAAGTQGATVTIDSRYDSGSYHVVSATYMGAEGATFEEASAKNVSAVHLGDMATSDFSEDVSLSLVFYVDFTQLENFRVLPTIDTCPGGTPDNFIPDMGSTASNRVFKLLDPKTGEWVRCINPGGQSTFVSTGGADVNGDGVVDDFNGDGIADLSLEHYKGYMLIPLYHFKRSNPGLNAGAGDMLDRFAAELNTIYRINIGVCPSGDGAEVDALDGAQYTIDNIGFTYDANHPAYKQLADARYANYGIKDESFDKQFGVKATTSFNFESAVGAIDPYDAVYLDAAIADADAKYALLNDYQRSLESVKESKALLEKYRNRDIETPLEAVNTPSKLSQEINKLPEAIRTLDFSAAENQLPSPGLVMVNGKLEPNYAAYGIKADDVDTIISYYEQGYRRFSKNDQTIVKTSYPAAYRDMITAYTAAMRLKELEVMAADLQVMEDGFRQNLYTVEVDKGEGQKEYHMEIANIAALKALDAQFKELPYFAKEMMLDGEANAQFKNAPGAIKRVLYNAEPYETSDGTNLKGGITVLNEKYRALYIMAKDHITEKTLFTAKELADIKYAVAEYEAMIPAYYNVNELYVEIDAIKALFDVYQMGFTNGTAATATLAVDGKDKFGTINFVVNYAEELSGASGDASTTYFIITKGTGTDIALSNAGIAYTLSLNNNTVKFGDKITAASLGILNNTHAKSGPLTLPIKADFGAEPPASPVLTDKIIITHYGADNVKIGEYVLTVQYSMGDSYTVSIPATVEVPFNDTTSQTKNVTVDHNMVTGAKLEVGLASANDYAMYRVGDTAKTSVFNYTAAFGDATKKTVFAGTGLDVTGVTSTLTVTIPEAQWKKAAVDDYQDELTFYAAYTPKA